jgi:hypothetical protein
MQYFADLRTVGVDVAETCARLKERWPGRSWVEGFEAALPFQPELVIASDVIEHLVNPDELLIYIKKLRPRYIVLSTPDRNLMRYTGAHNGPPINTAHIREWSFAEFRAYVQEFYDIDEHFISYPAQATQCVLCRPRM